MNEKLNTIADVPVANQNNTAAAPVPLKELNLSARFLFDAVMEDLQTQQDVLSIIFGREIPLVKYGATEKEIRLSPLARSIRMDIFSIDEGQTIYNTEMQDKRKTDLAKRSRYYQSLMDTSLLEPGIPDYNRLNQTYLIMIITFDLFGYQKYRYTFVPSCREVSDCELEDGAVRIFLNTKGKNEDEVPRELVAFLHYVEHTTDEEAARADSERIRRIHERVCRVRASEEIGVKYMQAWEERYYDREEAREEGRTEGIMKGKEEGLEEGRAEGKEMGIHALINICRKFKHSREETLTSLCEEFSLSPEEAEQYLLKYRED